MPDAKRRWIEERKRDVYHRKAKALGYRSRATFKLLQMDSKFRLLRPGAHILDLGSSPGGWAQYASERVGSGGVVVAVDASEMKPLGLRQVRLVKADVMNEGLELLIASVMRPGSADVVLSDLAPDMTGKYEIDHDRQITLAKRALEVASTFLKKGGALVVKVFEGKRSGEVERRAEFLFRRVRKVRPEASRKRSSEYYLVCLGFRAQ